MNSVSLTGNDSVTINNQILSDFADGDIAVLTFPNKIANAKTGKNGNTIYALNASGQQFELVIRVIRASNDDKFLNNLLIQQNSNFAGTVLAIGELVKLVGDGQGNVQNDTYVLGGMVFEENVGAKSNAEGDVEQSVAIYHLRGSKAPRSLT